MDESSAFRQGILRDLQSDCPERQMAAIEELVKSDCRDDLTLQALQATAVHTQDAKVRQAASSALHSPALVERVRQLQAQEPSSPPVPLALVQGQATLYRITTELARIRAPKALCETVIRAGREILGYRCLGIFLLEPGTGDRVLQAQSGWDDAPQDWRLGPGEGLSERACLTGALKYWSDVTREPAYIPGLRESHSELDVPIKIGDTVLGVLIAEDTRGDAFHAGDFEVLQAIANQLAVALENAHLFEDTQTRLAQLTALQETTQALVSTLELDQLLQLITQHAATLLHGEGGILNLVDWETQEDEVVTACGSCAHTVGQRSPLGESLSGWVTLHNQPTISNQLQSDPRVDRYVRSGTMHNASAAVAPLTLKGQVIGTLVALDKQDGTKGFNPSDLDLLIAFANQAATAIEHARLYKEVQRELGERKQAQEALSKRTAELEQAYQALQANQERLLMSEKMASLGRLTAGIAHEMNTPLATVRSSLAELHSLAAEYRSSIGDAEVTLEDHRHIVAEMEQMIQLAETAADRAAAFVRGIKAQTRNMPANERQRMDALALTRDTLLLLSHALRKGGCTAKIEAVEDQIELYGSPGRFSQVVTNLVTNAIDASIPKGGGPVTLRLSSRRGGVELEVSDTGCGIPPENLPRIFDPLFTTKPFGQGTGLGLTIVHDIVTGDFGGTLEVSTQVGQGTTIRIQFPQSQEAS